jgi:hypothetical protein
MLASLARRLQLIGYRLNPDEKDRKEITFSHAYLPDIQAVNDIQIILFILGYTSTNINK